MTVQPATVTVTGTQGAQATGHDALRDVDMNDFLKLMIAELQNQDPMNPMDNTQMLQQIGQIREIASNDRLSETLDAMLLGQNLATGANLIGQSVVALSDGGSLVTGAVTSAAVEDGKVKLHLIERIEEHYDSATGKVVPEQTKEHTVSIKNISQVLPDDADLAQLAQKIAAASSLVGRTIVGVADDSQVVTGLVEQVAIENGAVQLLVGTHRVDLANLTHVVQEPDTTRQPKQTDTTSDDDSAE